MSFSAQRPLKTPSDTKFVGDLRRGEYTAFVTSGSAPLRLERSGGFALAAAHALGSLTLGTTPSSVDPETLDAFLVLGGSWAGEQFFAVISAQEPERVQLHALVQQLSSAALHQARLALSGVLEDTMLVAIPAPQSIAELYESKPRRPLVLRRK
jgi:hypothetical protein